MSETNAIQSKTGVIIQVSIMQPFNIWPTYSHPCIKAKNMITIKQCKNETQVQIWWDILQYEKTAMQATVKIHWIPPKFAMLWFKICFTDHNEILLTSRQYYCHDVCKISLWSAECVMNKSIVKFHWISNLIEISLVGQVPRHCFYLK